MPPAGVGPGSRFRAEGAVAGREHASAQQRQLPGVYGNMIHLEPPDSMPRLPAGLVLIPSAALPISSKMCCPWWSRMKGSGGPGGRFQLPLRGGAGRTCSQYTKKALPRTALSVYPSITLLLLCRHAQRQHAGSNRVQSRRTGFCRSGDTEELEKRGKKA